MERINVCLMNDSFPPFIDGVANAVVNYANIISRGENTAAVVTPSHPDAEDSRFSFPVLRYPSFNTTKLVGYRTGVPFSPETLKNLQEQQINLIHCHCPFVSAALARSLRNIVKAPLVFTYHTKFDIDINKAVKNKLLRKSATKIVVQNIEACDDVWVVSRGAGENLCSLGYKGDYIVMPNGVDIPKGRVDNGRIAATKEKYGIQDGVPCFLYIGRMMWYKNLRLTIDALRIVHKKGQPFKMIFVGDGLDCEDIKKYVKKRGLDDHVLFTGMIGDREEIRAICCACDAFLFPSTYDTNGLVVREAAACSLPSILVEGSCAAEDAEDGVSAFFAKENPHSVADAVLRVCGDLEFAKQVGVGAAEKLYLSWEDAVKKAEARYRLVAEKYERGEYPQRTSPSDDFFMAQGKIMEGVSRAYSLGKHFMRKDKEAD